MFQQYSEHYSRFIILEEARRFMQVFLHIVTNNVMPVFVIIFLGYLLSKKFPVDLNTLSKVYFYVFLPAFLFVNLYSAKISTDMLLVLAFVIIIFAINLVVSNII